jgi:hypothetical protein
MPKTATRGPKRDEELNEAIIELAKRARIGSWNEFVEELKVPSELVPALITMRPELIRLAPARELTAEEAQALYTLIGALVETNMALRDHAQGVATMVQNWAGSIYGMVKVAGRIGRFAEFRHNDAASEDEDEES